MHTITTLRGWLALTVALATGTALAADQVITEWDQMTNAAASKIMNDAGARFEKSQSGFQHRAIAHPQ